MITNEENTSGAWRYTLDSGQSVEIDFRTTATLPGGFGGGPGSLLFYGDGDDPWYFGLDQIDPAELPGCYFLPSKAVDSDAHIVFENGLQLPKAQTFDGQGWPQNGRYDMHASGGGFKPFCINSRGEVTAYLSRP